MLRAPAVLCAAVLLGSAAAQERVTLQHERRVAGPLERAVAGLLIVEQRPEAMRELWRAGAPAVPLLVHEVVRDSEAAGPALAVLEAIGGAARPAVPALQRLAAAGGHRHAVGIGLALAAIGERDAVLLADWASGRVLELDADGKERRRVDYPTVWGARPISGDRLLVTSDGNHKVEEIDWTGKVHWSAAVPLEPLDARRLPDGTTVVACWSGACLVRLDAAGKELWRLPEVHAVDVEPLWNGNFLVCGYEDKRLVECDAHGEIIWQLALPDQPMDADVLPDGNLLVAFDKARRIDEYTRDGKVVATLQPPADPEDVWRLADGRTVLADVGGAVLLDRDGAVRWRYAAGHSGHIFATLAPAPDAR